jgi:hypothetical protein
MIPPGAIYAKTQSGADEVRNRKMKLPPKLRTMLILIDGTKPALLLRDEATSLGLGTDFLEQLEKMGLVERVGNVTAASDAGGATQGVPEMSARSIATMDPVTRYRMAQQFMNDTAVNALGIKAFFFTLKLERCATIDDLRALTGDYRAAMAKAGGDAEAEILSHRLDELLGPQAG